MGRQSARGDDAAIDDGAEPMLVTEWGDFVVRGGVLFVPFRCGSATYMLAMGPAMAFDAIDRARKALSRGIVDRLLGEDEPATH